MRAPLYDADVIKEHASRLYNLAEWMTAKSCFYGVVVGVAAGFGIITLARPAEALAIWAGITIAGGIGGAMVGSRRAFRYRLEAQQALCLAKIESNTRTAPNENYK